MSVCIAAMIGSSRSHARIVAVADRKASSQEFSNDDAVLKGRSIGHGWYALFVGNDVSPYIPIWTAVTKRFMKEKEPWLETITSIFEEEFQAHLSRLATSHVLGRWKMSMEKFLEKGRKQFGADAFDAMHHQISQVRLSCRFLVAGFDPLGPHILEVSNPGVVQVRDTPGYWAIGDGAAAAMSILGYFKQNVTRTLPETYYNVWAAKFMAEQLASGTVGKESFTWELSQDSDTSESRWDVMAACRTAWKAGGEPTIPKGAISNIETLLKSPASD